nr:MAG TPA: hypothetical protein [Caudoviricetes sp.]
MSVFYCSILVNIFPMNVIYKYDKRFLDIL